MATRAKMNAHGLIGILMATAVSVTPVLVGCSSDGTTTSATAENGGAGGKSNSGCGSNQTLCGDNCVDLRLDPAHCGTCDNVCSAGQVCSGGVCGLICGGGTTKCDGLCVNTTNDPANCGGCGNKCAPDQVCSGGTCGLVCNGGTTKCGTLCIDTGNDPANCGGCNNACASGQICSGGTCGLVCNGGTTKCGTSCIDASNDFANCGECNNACAPGEVCSGGTCGLVCNGGTTKCGTSCIDITNDPAHCGACGNACPAGQVCSGGTCGLLCSGGTIRCGTICADPANDPMNCGGCGNACAPGQVCSGGICGLVCGGGTKKCGSLCVNTTTDPANCGSCNTACAPGQVCSGGSCGLVCAGGSIKCGMACVNPSNDAAHCGGCGIACPAGQVCAASVCGLVCSGGTTKCGNSCVNTASDPANCGVCGNACFAGQVCAAGMCLLVCPGGTTKCGNICTNTANDPANCGMCGNVCDSYAGASGVCSSSSCLAVCDVGKADCNGTLMDGCESTTATDSLNCGVCGNVCPSGPSATAHCISGSCSLSCASGTGDCNNDPTDGCETNIYNSAEHCGFCGNSCPPVPNATPLCLSFMCGYACNANFATCDNNPGNGCETNTQTNASHCGMCNFACAAGLSCVNGTCTASSIPPINGTQTNDIVRGSTQNGFFADPITGKIYWHDLHFGTQIFEYPNLANFVANTDATTINLASQFEGTYHAALNGFIYYNVFNTNTLVRVSAATGAVVSSAPLAGAGFHNQSNFQWGGYSDICFYTDSGNLLYVLYAAPGGGNMQAARLDPTSLAIQQTWSIPRGKQQTGFAFLVNGNFYFGFNYTSPAINAKFSLTTSVYDTAYSNSLTPVSGEYINALYWDPSSKRLFEVSNAHHLVYPNVQ